jgi:Rrf2 family protein
MRITYKGDYALKTLLYLALNEGRLSTIQKIAKNLDIPVKFLEQVLLELKRAGFVNSKRGKIGGYFLAKPAKDIRLGEVIRFIDGPLEPIACVDNNYKDCQDIKFCVLRKIWQEITEKISSFVDKISFEDLVNEVKKKEKELVYII